MSLGQNFHAATPTPLKLQFVSDVNEKQKKFITTCVLKNEKKNPCNTLAKTDFQVRNVRYSFYVYVKENN